MLPTAETKVTGECGIAEQPLTNHRQCNFWLGCSPPNAYHPAAAASWTPRQGVSHCWYCKHLFSASSAKQSYLSTPGERPASLQAAEKFGCLFSTKKAVKSLSESRTHTDMLQQTRWMANLPANSSGLLLATCVNCGIWFQLPLQGMTSLAGLEQQHPPDKMTQLQEVILSTLPQADKPRSHSQYMGSLIPNSTSAHFSINSESLLYFLFC